MHISRTAEWVAVCSTDLGGRVWAKRHPREDSIWEVRAKEIRRMVGKHG